MKVIVSERAGFCFGVRRAIKMSRETLDTAKKKATPGVYTLGPLVHNPDVIEQLEKEGIFSIDKPSKIKSGCLIIRTHGTTPKIYKDALKRKLKVIDATCPLVRKIHNIVRDLSKQKYKIIIIGHKDHPEVKGIASYAPFGCKVIESVREAEDLKMGKNGRIVDKLGIVVQTTFLLSNFRQIVPILIDKAHECRIFNTICSETKLRQAETLDLAKEVDIMIVVGGKSSSNTRRLFEICRKFCPSTYLVEGASQIKKSWFSGKRKAGLTAGASTPDGAIEEVLNKVKKI
ncbi:MAG: 4-hydroxy-3-methylbut-2-enyl diphosphate reductase [Armatimonadota bacterium]